MIDNITNIRLDMIEIIAYSTTTVDVTQNCRLSDHGLSCLSYFYNPTTDFVADTTSKLLPVLNLYFSIYLITQMKYLYS